MRIVLLTHPAFLNMQSIPRFAGMLEKAFQARGHTVELWAPKPRLHRLTPPGRLAKWAGYVDQYLIFPLWLRGAVKRKPADTLFVLTDQALGPWVPYLNHRPLVVHVHDLLALRSALGGVPENPTGFTGRIYQGYIRWGFEQASHFICISRRTLQDFKRFTSTRPRTTEVVYNGLNYPFEPTPAVNAVQILKAAGYNASERGFLLHVSGNQWYKNVTGVIKLYAHYASAREAPLALWLVGVRLTPTVQDALNTVPSQGQVNFVQGLSSVELQAAYSLAQVFLFPSLAEGFGWPIVEAQACGCPVITTNDAPMNEIGGPESRYLPVLDKTMNPEIWAQEGATVLSSMLDVNDVERQRRSCSCVKWAQNYHADVAINGYLSVYEAVMDLELKRQPATTIFEKV